MALVEAHEITKNFGKQQVLSPLSFRIEEQEFVCLLGPSGCGKSTLLRLLAGLEIPTRGTLSIAPDAQSQRSLVFQDATLLSWRTAVENVMLPLELAGTLVSDEIKAKARAELIGLGLEPSLDRLPRELSGGMKMRTAIARSLVQLPKLLLMDEPFAALDEYTRFQLQEKLRKLFTGGKNKMSVVFVTHSVSEAVFLADRVFILSSAGALSALEVVRLPALRDAKLRKESLYFQELQRLQSLVSP